MTDFDQRLIQIFGARGELHMACSAIRRAHNLVLADIAALDQALVLALLFDHADRALKMLSEILSDETLKRQYEQWVKDFPQIRELRNAVAHFDEYLVGEGRAQNHRHELTGLAYSVAEGKVVELYLGSSTSGGTELRRLEFNVTKALESLGPIADLAWQVATKAVSNDG